MEHDKNYGSPRIWNALRKTGIHCSENRVARQMRKNNLVAVQRRKYRATTNSKHNWPVAPNIVSRNFMTDAPNKIWFTDMTYIWTYEGWLYLAFVLDLYNRSVVGLSMASQMTDELTQSALKQAIMHRRPPEGLIHHSDRGSQYASGEYQELLKKYKITPSMSRKGDCWDNAPMESANGTFKVECVHGEHFRTRAEAQQALIEYIGYYNTERRHSSLGNLSPAEFERRWHATTSQPSTVVTSQ